MARQIALDPITVTAGGLTVPVQVQAASLNAVGVWVMPNHADIPTTGATNTKPGFVGYAGSGKQRACVVRDLSLVREHRADEQILGPRIGRALHDVHRLTSAPRRRHGERRLADAGPADDARRERQIVFRHQEPAGEQLPEGLGLTDPFDGYVDRMR